MAGKREQSLSLTMEGWVRFRVQREPASWRRYLPLSQGLTDTFRTTAFLDSHLLSYTRTHTLTHSLTHSLTHAHIHTAFTAFLPMLHMDPGLSLLWTRPGFGRSSKHESRHHRSIGSKVGCALVKLFPNRAHFKKTAKIQTTVTPMLPFLPCLSRCDPLATGKRAPSCAA